MSCRDEPIIVVIHSLFPEPRRMVLADVVIVAAEERASPDRSGELFTRYPGLSLVLQTHPSGEITAGLRDGTTLTLRPSRAQPTAADTAAAAADLVRGHWDGGRRPHGTSGGRGTRTSSSASRRATTAARDDPNAVKMPSAER